jgi:cell wall-associated NlpC family hydrolase
MTPLLTRFRCALAALVAVALLLPAAAAGEQGQGESGLGSLRSAVVAALAHSRAGDALDTLSNSLALLGARYRLEHEGKGREARSQAQAPAEKAPPKIITDPEKMPPASAGSNGAYTPSDASKRGDLFAHVRDDDPTTSNAILLTGIALAPPDAPETVKGVINNANSIVGRPYVWGGGHGSWYSYGYDCSGSVSFALFVGGLIPEPLTSGALEGWGAPGPGKWITVYANAGHTFAEIAGLRWDTVCDENGTGPRWHLASTSTAGFVARHPPGL